MYIVFISWWDNADEGMVKFAWATRIRAKFSERPLSLSGGAAPAVNMHDVLVAVPLDGGILLLEQDPLT